MSNSLTTDVLIIGSGPIGATYARFLTFAGRKVIMIESGKQLSARPGEHLANAFQFQQQPNLFPYIIQGHLSQYSPLNTSNYLNTLNSIAYNPDNPKMRKNFENLAQIPELSMPWAAPIYAVGGMFTHWTACAPDPAPSERTPLIAAEDWEIILDIARQLFNVHTDAFEPSMLNQLLREELNANGFSVENLPMAVESRNVDYELAHLVTWTGMDTVLGPLADYSPEFQDRFQILAEHRAEKLIYEGGKITSVHVRNLANNSTLTISAQTTIVTGGPILTPRLLWQSGIRPNALGRYLNANPVAASTIVLKKEIVEKMRLFPNNKAKKAIIPIPHNDPEPMLGFSSSSERPWHAQIQRAGNTFANNSNAIDVRLLVQLLWFGNVDPVHYNRICFSDDVVDRFNQPQITFEYQWGPEDKQRANRMMSDMINAAQTMGGFLPGGGEPAFQPQGSTLHYQGTYRMGGDNAQHISVVNTHSKVWGFDNLYLGGIGVIPTKMANNPTLTACAIAVFSLSDILQCSLEELKTYME